MFKMWMSVDSLTVQFAQQEVVLIVRRIWRKWIFVTKLWIIWRLLLRIWRRWRLGWSRQWHLDISITFDLNLLLPILFNVHSVDLLGQGKTKFVTITRICKNNVSSIYRTIWHSIENNLYIQCQHDFSSYPCCCWSQWLCSDFQKTSWIMMKYQCCLWGP